jgi:hypothetical protein
MKNFVLGMAATLMIGGMLVAGTSNAGLFSSFATANWPTQKSTAYKVEAYGFDFRVYEWRSTTDPSILCTAGFTDSAAIGLQCLDTGE